MHGQSAQNTGWLRQINESVAEALLGRPPAQINTDAIAKLVRGRRIMVTGAGGSIGSELCRQLMKFEPSEMVLLDHAENPLFFISEELKRRENSPTSLQPVIGDICDAERMDKVFSDHLPQVVFHAAAHKHVPLMESNPGEAIKNNVFGTQTVADAAERHGADTFVLFSTDKAVNASSVMGATKRVAERYCQWLGSQSKTCRFVTVRFGNVLGSVGSVLPTFIEQIDRGGPVTVTDPEVTRYFMTIPEACRLVMQAAALGDGGETFLLDMGEPVKIADLAKKLILLRGRAGKAIDIKYVGLRPGEKLSEELHTAREEFEPTDHPKITKHRASPPTEKQMRECLTTLAAVTNPTGDEEAHRTLNKILKNAP